MSKIVRTPTRAEGGITSEEKERMDAHAQLWIKRAMRTDPIEPNKIVPAIEGLYAAAGLKTPRVVIAPSPLVMAFAYGAAAAIWYARKNPTKRDATRDATNAATNAATDAATRAATWAAAYDATREATDAATREATDAATWDATDAATDAATWAATREATRTATYDATREATDAATDAATLAAMDAATRTATDAATRAATWAATWAATLDATWAATDAATWAATLDAANAATRDATLDATWAATRAAMDAATRTATDAATRAATWAATDAATWAATLAATDAATWAATLDAANAATRDATLDATWAATNAATNAATDAATRAATWAATLDAANAATRDATLDATWAATRAATLAATDAAAQGAQEGAALACSALAGKLGLECAKSWSNAYQGGNMWAGYESYLTAARDILGLRLPAHEKYAAWEQAAIHGGFRVLHEEFCIVSDFPEILKVDDQNRPHCADGPSHRWRDGWSLYHWHGVKVPAHWIECRDTLTAAEIFKEENAEVRRGGCGVLGWDRVLGGIDAKLVNDDGDPFVGVLYEGHIPGAEPCGFLKVKCGTGRDFVIPVPAGMSSALAAQAWMQGVPEKNWIKPEVRG